MIQISKKDSDETIAIEAIRRYKSKCKLAFIYSGVSNILFLLMVLYIAGVCDRVIGSGNIIMSYIGYIMIISILLTYFICTIPQIYIGRGFKKVEEWLDNESFAKSNQYKSFFSSARVNIILDAIWSVIFFVYLFFLHVYVGFAVISGIILVAGLVYLVLYRNRNNLNKLLLFHNKKAGWLYVINQNITVFIMYVPLVSLILACYRSFLINKKLKVIDSFYTSSKLSIIVLFLKELLIIAIVVGGLFIIAGVSAYIVVSSNGVDMSTGDMLASIIIASKLLSIFTNLIFIRKDAFNVFKYMTC